MMRRRVKMRASKIKIQAMATMTRKAVRMTMWRWSILS
jgi:hypothetical protein